MPTPEFAPQGVHVDFAGYIYSSRRQLLVELTDAHQSIANLSIDIAFLKEEEERTEGQPRVSARVLRRQMEGTLAAYTEKKWLLKTLLEFAEDRRE